MSKFKSNSSSANSAADTPAKLVYDLVRQIPPGKVSTYGDIARWIGLKTPRQVGWILHRNPSSDHCPCHRVVFSDGKLSGQFAFGGGGVQQKMLESEGVEFQGEKVDMKKSLWSGK